MKQTWTEAQKFESNFWGNCYNKQTFNEIIKQQTYIPALGLDAYADDSGDLNLQGKSVLDVGGGPFSILLRAHNYGYAVVADPLTYPPSVWRRYTNYDIRLVPVRGEDLFPNLQHRLPAKDGFDEIWMYNVLQHTEQPDLILQNIRKLGKTIRIFDWVNKGVSPGHPVNLTKEFFLTNMAGCQIEKAVVSNFSANECFGQGFSGVFESDGRSTEVVPVRTIAQVLAEDLPGWKILTKGVDLDGTCGIFAAVPPEVPYKPVVVTVEAGRILGL